MGVDAEELIIRPFKEVVERGADAVANAEAAAGAEHVDPDLSERMLKVARGVMREGERALKKIQPIWDGQVERYGDTFKEAMMDQGTRHHQFLFALSSFRFGSARLRLRFYSTNGPSLSSVLL